MLFLGTRTYPKPGEYQQFMSRHGGSNNAWTGTEFTNFFFDIDNGFFEAGLDRFSQFFICPTFAPEWVDKERNAVDSEYRLKLQDDVRRSYQVHKETVNPDHPFSKFSVGNLDTLADLPAGICARTSLRSTKPTTVRIAWRWSCFHRHPSRPSWPGVIASLVPFRIAASALRY
jgi:secreted Zn-dependent insulinase-like peptidase